MKTLISLPVALLLAWGAVAAEEPRPAAQAGPLIQTHNFDFDEDLDADKQPDFWTRTIDETHPHYVPGGLDFERAYAGRGSLRIKGDGAPAEYMSPVIPIEGSSAYDVSGFIKTESLTATGPRKSRAYLEARLYDGTGKLTGVVRCFPEIAGTTDWELVSASDVSGKTPGVVSLRVAAVLEGLSLTGYAWFDCIEVRKRPIASLRTNRAANCFYSSDKKTVAFEARGLPTGQYATALVVRDVAGKERHSVNLTPAASPEGVLSVSYVLPPLDLGAYTIDVRLLSSDSLLLSQSVRMGVLPDRALAETSRNFGVSFSKAPAPLSAQYELTYVSGVGWLKIPLVGAPSSSDKSRYLRTVTEVRSNGIIPVGIITSPEEAGSTGESKGASPVLNLPAYISSGVDTWLPPFKDTINTFVGSVLYWQLGKDDESAVARSPAAPNALVEIDNFINAVSYNAKLGVPVDSAGEAQALSQSRVAFAAIDATHLGQGGKGLPAGIEFWAWIDPSAWMTGEGGDLVEAARRISSAFAGGASVVFLEDPWDVRGILDGEGNVTPFGLALVNLVNQLSNYTYAGSIAFPNNTPNAVFASVENTKVLIWPDKGPAEERIFLGESVDVCDLYGTRTPAPIENGENVIQVKDAPAVLAGVDPAIVETRKTFAIEPDTIDSVYEVQPIYVTFCNKFGTAIAGELALSFPPGWEAQPDVFSVRLKPGEAFRGRANLVVPYNALAGDQDIKATLQLGDIGSQRITLVQRRQLASRTFKMEIDTRSSGAGAVVYQKVTNISDRPVDVNAFLEGEGIERVERLPRRIEPGASVTFTYTLADAAAWKNRKLRASVREAKTNRFLNDEFLVSLASQ